MRKILKGIILSLIIIGLIKTFNEYDVIHCANHYFEQIKSGKIIEDIKIDHFNNYHNLLPTCCSKLTWLIIFF